MTEILKKISKVGIVAVVRANSVDEAIKISEACIAGGIPAIEVTFTIPNALEVIEALAKKFDENQLILGAGTVLDKETAANAVKAGAKYIVSPGFDTDTALYLKSINIPYLPGCLTITEMLNATKYGSEVVKLFPGSAFGASYVKAVKGPLPWINIMPTGGVSLDNVDQWIKNGVIAVGVGGELTAPAKTGNFAEITNIAKQFVAKISEARK